MVVSGWPDTKRWQRRRASLDEGLQRAEKAGGFQRAVDVGGIQAKCLCVDEAKVECVFFSQGVENGL